MLPALSPEPTRHGSIHGGVAGHFLHGVAPSAATSTSVGAAAALALARAAALLLLSVPCLVCSCYCSCSRCCSRSCSCLRCCSDLATLQSTESTFGSVDFQGVGGGARRGEGRTSRSGEGGSPERYPTIYLRVQGGGGGPRGLAGAAVASCFGAARRRWGRRFGRWWLAAQGGCRLKMNCRPSLNYMSSASLLPLRSVSIVAFRFHSKFQFRQLSSESTVFTSSVVVRWFLVM